MIQCLTGLMGVQDVMSKFNGQWVITPREPPDVGSKAVLDQDLLPRGEDLKSVTNLAITPCQHSHDSVLLFSSFSCTMNASTCQLDGGRKARQEDV